MLGRVDLEVLSKHLVEHHLTQRKLSGSVVNDDNVGDKDEMVMLLVMMLKLVTMMVMITARMVVVVER